eukprot:6033812-Lingulodinium_polyedra.AAC.1
MGKPRKQTWAFACSSRPRRSAAGCSSKGCPTARGRAASGKSTEGPGRLGPRGSGASTRSPRRHESSSGWPTGFAAARSGVTST